MNEDEAAIYTNSIKHVIALNSDNFYIPDFLFNPIIKNYINLEDDEQTSFRFNYQNQNKNFNDALSLSENEAKAWLKWAAAYKDPTLFNQLVKNTAFRLPDMFKSISNDVFHIALQHGNYKHVIYLLERNFVFSPLESSFNMPAEARLWFIKKMLDPKGYKEEPDTRWFDVDNYIDNKDIKIDKKFKNKIEMINSIELIKKPSALNQEDPFDIIKNVFLLALKNGDGEIASKIYSTNNVMLENNDIIYIHQSLENTKLHEKLKNYVVNKIIFINDKNQINYKNEPFYGEDLVEQAKGIDITIKSDKIFEQRKKLTQ
jgi:hypothetical protein